MFPVTSGVPVTAEDADLDGIPDELDNCPETPNPGQSDSDFNGIGDACQVAGELYATSAFLNATIEGSTVSDETSLVIGDEPSIEDRLALIVDYFLEQGLIDDAAAFTQNLVDSLVEIGQVAAEDADQLVEDVLLLVILPIIDINIDIKPGSDPNSISARNRGVIPVAILSTPEFDAPAEVDAASLTFGRTGDEDSLRRCVRGSEDVNDDGLLDQLCFFNTQETGFSFGDTEGILRGSTLDGVPIEGRDTVRIVPPGGP